MTKKVPDPVGSEVGDRLATDHEAQKNATASSDKNPHHPSQETHADANTSITTVHAGSRIANSRMAGAGSSRCLLGHLVGVHVSGESPIMSIAMAPSSCEQVPDSFSDAPLSPQSTMPSFSGINLA